MTTDLCGTEHDDPNAKTITEKDGEQEKWYEQAGKMTLADLPSFLKHLMQDYNHDYGTVCHALAAGAVATCWAMDREPRMGGITGFQSGAVMWEFVRRWAHKDGPMRLLEFEWMLYPQHADRFAKTISKSTWMWLQEQARKKSVDGGACDAVSCHWQSISDGIVPFGYVVVDD